MATQKAEGRTFKVTKGQVGPFPKGHKFTEAEFKRLNPLPKNEDAREAVGGDEYHNNLFARLKNLGVIQDAPDETPDPTPLGPETGINVGKPIINPALQGMVNQAVAQQASAQAATASPSPLKTDPTAKK